MNLQLENKTVLITGGSRGIGRALVEGFVAEGANVAFSYVNSREIATAFESELNAKYGERVFAIQADMACEKAVLELISTTEMKFGSIDVLVNNAAICPSGPITSYSVEEWEKTFATNVTGMFVASREVVRRLLESNRKGSIVNIASQAAFRGSTTGHLPYDSSKGAMVSFTIGLAREVAKHGIRVNGIAPGLVRTEMVAKTWEEKKERYLATIPLYRIAETEEIANIALFLASDKASYITGSTLDASGGMMMR